MSFNLCGTAAARSAGGVGVFAILGIADLLHPLWLLAAFSLVYAATRHEQIVAVLDHSWRFATKVGAVLLAVLVVLMWMSWRL